MLRVERLSVNNDGRRTARELALSIDSLIVGQGDLVFVLGARGDGKTALRDTLKTIVESAITDTTDIVLPQSDGKPDVCARRIQVRPNLKFHCQCGDPQTVPPPGDLYLVFCDDPMYPTGTDHPTGPQIIDLAREREHALMIGTDPDRLGCTLSHFLSLDTGRILWLRSGTKYFDGTIELFQSNRKELCRALDEANAETARLLEIVRAVRPQQVTSSTTTSRIGWGGRRIVSSEQ